MQQQTQPVHVVYVTQPPPSTQQPEDELGRFGAGFSASGSRICAGLIGTAGTLAFIGAIMESAYTGFNYKLTSVNDYAGYWCSLLMIVSSGIASDAAKHMTDTRIIMNLVGAVIGEIFSCTLIGLTADVVDVFSLLDIVMQAAYGIMLAGGSAGIVLAAILICICLKAIICSNKVGHQRNQIQIQQQYPTQVDQPQAPMSPYYQHSIIAQDG
jgi:hypothetical protein